LGNKISLNYGICYNI